MITVSDLARSILDGPNSYELHIQVQSWLGDQLLADDVPVTAGSEESDRSLRVPERVTLTVPRVVDGVDWAPADDTSPLAAKGQILKISLGIGVGPDGIEWFQRGEFLIQETEEDDDGQTLTVTAVGLLALIDEANFVAPFQPTGTLVSTLRALVEPALTVDVDNAPADVAVPAGAVNWDSDRLGAVGELLDAWPAVMSVTEQGTLEILPAGAPTTADVVRSFSTSPADPGGTIIAAVAATSRDGGFNVVVATGYATDGSEVRGLAYVRTGSWSYPDGQANPLPVPFFYSSPLLTQAWICEVTAVGIMYRKSRQSVLARYTVTAVPDPTLQLGDPVLITTDRVTDLLCTVEHINLPYFATGPMTVQVVSVS